jgi:ATP-dependent Lhr-like helicase
MAGLAAEVHDLGVTLPGTTTEQAIPLVRKIADLPPPSPDDVAEFVANVKAGKFAELVPDALARKEWARQNAASVKSVPAVASSLLVGF